MAGFLVNCSSAAVQLQKKQSQSLRRDPYVSHRENSIVVLPAANVRGPPDEYCLLTLGRPSVRCYSTRRAWSCVRQHASCQPCIQLFGSRLGFAVLKMNLSLLEGLDSHLLRVLQQKGIYTYLVRIQNFLFHFPFDEIYRRLLFFTLGRAVFRVNRLLHN